MFPSSTTPPLKTTSEFGFEGVFVKDPSLLSPFRVALLQNQVCDLIASDYHRLCSAPFASSSGLPLPLLSPPPSLDEHLRTLRITPLLVKGLIAGGRADSPMHILMPQTISFFFCGIFCTPFYGVGKF